MSSSGTSCRKSRRQKTSKQHGPVPPEESSGAPSRPAAVRSAGEEKKRTRGKAARAATLHPEPTPSPPAHTRTAHTAATHGHLPQNTSTCSQKSAMRGRRKITEKTERSDFIPEGRSDDRTDPDRTRTEQQQPKITQTHTQGQKRAAKHTHDTLVCPSSQQDTPLTSPEIDSGTRAPGRGRGRRPNPRRGSTPPTEPQIIPETETLPKNRPRCQNRDAQQRKRTRKKVEQGVCDVPPVKRQRKKRDARAELPDNQRIRTRFVLQNSEQLEPEDAFSSSDLSFELSIQEDKLSLTHSLSLKDEEEEEEDEEDEELPCFLQKSRQKSFPITVGQCVWCKLRKYPFWPAMVKSVNRKAKKASILFIDQFLFDKRFKGLTVSMRTLKPFDCEEYQHFVDIAKEKYGESISWCLKIIFDYRISIGCGSFVGSIIEYITDDMSYPLRSEYSKASPDLQSPTQSLMEQQDGDSELQDLEEHLTHDVHMEKKLLPDRTQAARNRANQRLVDFIVRKQRAQNRLLAVINGQEGSRWLQDLHSSSRLVVGQVYLEDDEQFNEVYGYLEELYESAAKANPAVETSDRIRFIMDVLFPEALICAIAAVDCLPLDKAEEKYRQGPRHSKRERQEFDLMIEQQMKLKQAGWSS